MAGLPLLQHPQLGHQRTREPARRPFPTRRSAGHAALHVLVLPPHRSCRSRSSSLSVRAITCSMASGVKTCSSTACKTASFISATGMRSAVGASAIVPVPVQSIRLTRPALAPAFPPPARRHTRRTPQGPPADSAWPSWAVAPTHRPLLNRRVLPSVSCRRLATCFHKSSGTIRNSSVCRVHSSAGRGFCLTCPQSSRCGSGSTTDHASVQGRGTGCVRTVDGAHPGDVRPSVRRGAARVWSARSAVRRLAMAFRP